MNATLIGNCSGIKLLELFFVFFFLYCRKPQPHSCTFSAISRRRSHVVVVVVLPQPCLVTSSPLAPPLREATDRVPTEHVLFPDFPEGRAEFLDPESVDDGVDGGVAVREDDGNVNEEHRRVAVGAEESDAVVDVEWKPADREEEQNQSQRLG